MNLDSANQLIRAVVEEAIHDEADAARVIADESFMARHTAALIREVSAADPTGTNAEAAHAAASEYARTIRDEIKAAKKKGEKR